MQSREDTPWTTQGEGVERLWGFKKHGKVESMDWTAFGGRDTHRLPGFWLWPCLITWVLTPGVQESVCAGDIFGVRHDSVTAMKSQVGELINTRFKVQEGDQDCGRKRGNISVWEWAGKSNGGRKETGEQVSWEPREESASRREHLVTFPHANYNSRELYFLVTSAEMYWFTCLTIT